MNTSVVNDSSPSSTLDNLNHYMAQTKYLFTIAYLLNLIMGLPTNVYVLWLIVTGAVGTMASEFFSLNLTVSEIIYCLFNVLTLLDYYLLNGLFLPARAFSMGLLTVSRPLFQCCICVERYLAVVHPVTFLKYKPLRYRVGFCGVVWLVVLGFCVVALFMSFSTTFYYFYMAQYLVVFSIELFCCLAVLRALRRPGPGEGEREGEGMSNMKRKAFWIILVILVSVVVSVLPVMVTVSFQGYLNFNDFYFALSISFSLIIISGFVQPLLYLHRAGKLACIRGPENSSP
ncbi:G-protein coupled receptor 35-like [Oncorhynchus nerka]|uniref:G-protein coupled receptor 35-like n=1 Tax=Oncorhynchus nerka TaxID=8023 RepID=UPI0031B89847